MMNNDEKELLSFLSSEAKDPQIPIFQSGEIVGSWRVLSFLGGGGFGEVYRVEHICVGIICALKVLRRNTENSRTRFHREIQCVACHNSPGVPRFFEVCLTGLHPYYVMELLSPRELPSTDSGVACLLQRLCTILSVLHEEGWVHRDIKPSNVLYRDNGEVVLIDYGLIKRVRNDGSQIPVGDGLTRVNAAVGTERYAAPEQLSGSVIDLHADIHALGVLIDTCFQGDLPQRWKRIVCRATSSLPEQRYPNCRALSRAIALRFWGELVVIGGIMVVMVLLALIIIHFPSGRRERNVAGSCDSETNVSTSVKCRNVSDSAGDWLVP